MKKLSIIDFYPRTLTLADCKKTSERVFKGLPEERRYVVDVFDSDTQTVVEGSKRSFTARSEAVDYYSLKVYEQGPYYEVNADTKTVRTRFKKPHVHPRMFAATKGLPKR